MSSRKKIQGETAFERWDDLALLQGVGRGCENSFRVLFRRWSPRLGRLLFQITGSRDVAEDLLQETFLRILKAAPQFKPGGSVVSWMYRICANLGYSYWRRRRSSPLLPPGHNDFIGDILAPNHESPDEKFLAGAFASDAQGAIRRLPPNQRMTFLLKIDQGLTYEEIALVLHCPTGTAKSRFHHAVRRLREELSAWDENKIPCWRNQDGL
ncbi:MAG: RNA polymerase sigma factor [Candidatus Eisenbacteria bacterium]|uniref:RNA polymerase sigma factor n=1 Tax=Eiseniibacteriota bacterium TaxID=2212470 RepID=A0A948S3L1_UNCEI|nr:RNA polymerase sigma factor [Candidatus Eisenbacteria bacterium]MBU1950324.1 RNA polymerase sigma factor [Candidatus Eisenbacteria bacterium]MBU2693184.1 RNA polymerase sigma factor [Candidatus Eisenbacteria bacterium]